MKTLKKIGLAFLLFFILTISFITFEFTHGYSSVSPQQTKEKKVSPAKTPEKITVVLIGSDARSKEENGRSDSLMVAQYEPKKAQGKLLSIMRDCYVDIPRHGKDKINAAYSYGGEALLNETLKNNFGLDAPYYVTVTFQEFIDFVDQLFPKGVAIDAEKDLELDGVSIKKGAQRMDGNTLLQYGRFREDEESDFGRIRRQQQVINALIDQSKQFESLLKLPKAAGQFLGQLDTNLPKGTLLSCGTSLLTSDRAPFPTLSIPVEGSWTFNDDTPSGSVLEIDTETNKQAIQEFLAK